jgi:aminotransferase
VTGRGITLIRRLFDGAPPGCINLGLGQPTDPVPPEARQAAMDSLASGHVPYTPTPGLDALREAIARIVYAGDTPASVLVTSGSQEALWIALMGLVDPGEDVLFTEPSYPAYRIVAEMIGARAVAVPVTFDGRWRLDPAAVRDAWTARTRALVIASPANPTGMAAGNDGDLGLLHSLCAEHEAYLVADELYAPISYRTMHRPMHELGDRVVAIHGIAKAFSGTGFRVGWLHAHPDVVAGLLPLHQQIALAAPTTGQHAALACLHLWGEPYFGELRALYESRRSAAVGALALIPGLRFHDPDGAFYVMVDVSSFTTETLDFALRLRDERKVITAPGEAFGASGAGYLRISFATTPERIREGIGLLGEMLARG